MKIIHKNILYKKQHDIAHVKGDISIYIYICENLCIKD